VRKIRTEISKFRDYGAGIEEAMKLLFSLFFLKLRSGDEYI